MKYLKKPPKPKYFCLECDKRVLFDDMYNIFVCRGCGKVYNKKDLDLLETLDTGVENVSK